MHLSSVLIKTQLIFRCPIILQVLQRLLPAKRNPVPVGEFLQVARQSTGRNISSPYTGSAKLCDILSNSVGTILLPPAKGSLGQGNVFTPVCQSFCSQWPPKRAGRILLECILV